MKKVKFMAFNERKKKDDIIMVVVQFRKRNMVIIGDVFFVFVH